MTDETYNPDAIDGDGDGMVQDGTEFERPVGTQLDGFKADAKDGDGDGLVQDGTKFERPVVAEEAVEPVVDEPVQAPTSDATVITGKSVGGSNEEQILAPVADGVIGTGTKKKTEKVSSPKKPAKPAVKKAAIFSDRNLVWQGVGKIAKGYNFVDKDLAAKWATLEGVREATPEEIKTNLG